MKRGRQYGCAMPSVHLGIAQPGHGVVGGIGIPTVKNGKVIFICNIVVCCSVNMEFLIK